MEWPYLRDNPMIDNKNIKLLKTQSGYYVVPGDGVKLPNGKIMGTDLVIDKSTNMQQLIAEGGDLNYKNRPLSTFIPTASSRIAQLANDLIITIKKCSLDLSYKTGINFFGSRFKLNS